MTSVNPKPQLKRQTETFIRVRYKETDAQGRVHHANYINYFEIGRVEMLRESGFTYRELEDTGIMLVVTELDCKYHQAAMYDDQLRVVTTVIRAKGVRVHQEYHIYCGETLVAEGSSIVACVNRNGEVTRLPKWLTVLASDG